MKIALIGDIFGKPGRDAVKKALPELRVKESLDLVVANAENIHHGKGLSEEKVVEILNHGVDICTSGNHVFKYSVFYDYLNKTNSKVIRPANYPDGAPGKGYQEIKCAQGKKILIINLMGRIYMHNHLECPFKTADRIIKEKRVKLGKNYKAVMVDFHAETTSEKIALGHYLDGRVTAVLGTHTHVTTADECVLEKGTAFQCDVGMTGPLEGVIGIQKELIIENFLTQLPVRHDVAEGKKVFNATIVEIDDKSGLALSVRRINRIFD